MRALHLVMDGGMRFRRIGVGLGLSCDDESDEVLRYIYRMAAPLESDVLIAGEYRVLSLIYPFFQHLKK